MPGTSVEYSQALRRDLMEYYGASLQKYAAAAGELLFEQKTTDQAVANMGRIGGTGTFPTKGEGVDPVTRKPIEGANASITPVSKSLLREFSREVVEDARGAGQDIQSAANDFAQGYMATKDEQCAAVLKSTANIYDGVALFASNHPQRSTGSTTTYSNLVTGATVTEVKWDDLLAALTLLQDTNAKNEDGEKIDIWASHVICTSYKQFMTAQSVISANGLADVANNNANPLELPGSNKLTPILWRRAADSTSYWYVAQAQMGLVYVTREEMSIATGYDDKARVYWASPYYRGEAGVRDWRGIARVSA